MNSNPGWRGDLRRRVYDMRIVTAQGHLLELLKNSQAGHKTAAHEGPGKLPH